MNKKGRPKNVGMIKEVVKYASILDETGRPLLSFHKIGTLMPKNSKGKPHHVKTVHRWYNDAVTLGHVDKKIVRARKEWGRKFNP